MILVTRTYLPKRSAILWCWQRYTSGRRGSGKKELVLLTRILKIPCFTIPKMNKTTLRISKTQNTWISFWTILKTILDEKHGAKNEEWRLMYIYKRTLGSKWGLQPRIILYMYAAVVRPIYTMSYLYTVFGRIYKTHTREEWSCHRWWWNNDFYQ